MGETVRALMLGDVIGEPGLKAMFAGLGELVRRLKVDLVVANGENAAAGFGITSEETAKLFSNGVQVITSGNHVWEKKGAAELLAADPPSGLPLPAMVMTKSALALRDLELWRRVNERAGFLLMVSLTSQDEDLRAHMEPGASSFAERLALLKAFKAAGCATGILAMPFLPALSDGEDSIRALYAAAAEAKVDFIMPGGLTLRPGRQKDLYLETLAAYRPDLVEQTRKIFMDERPSGWPGAEATKVLMGRIAPIQKESGLPHLLPHAVYARILPHHDALRILFLDMSELYADRSVPTGTLKRSAKAYDAWLLAKRREFRRKRSLPASWLEEALPGALASGELGRIIDNAKLLDFIKAVVLEGARLDYRSLKLH